MIKSDSRDVYNVFKRFKRLIFQINAVGFEFFSGFYTCNTKYSWFPQKY